MGFLLLVELFIVGCRQCMLLDVLQYQGVRYSVLGWGVVYFGITKPIQLCLDLSMYYQTYLVMSRPGYVLLDLFRYYQTCLCITRPIYVLLDLFRYIRYLLGIYSYISVFICLIQSGVFLVLYDYYIILQMYIGVTLLKILVQYWEGYSYRLVLGYVLFRAVIVFIVYWKYAII